MDQYGQIQKIKSEQGITLVELLVVMVIIGILATVAIPSYTNYINRNKLADAVSNLHDLRLRMEQSYQDNRTYQGGAGCAIQPPNNLEAFTITCVAPGRRNYTLTAKSKPDVGLGAEGAYEYTIDQSGAMLTVMFDGVEINEPCLRVSGSC